MKLILELDPTYPPEREEAIQILMGSKYKILIWELFQAFRNKWKYAEEPPKSWDEVRELFFSVEGVAEALE